MLNGSLKGASVKKNSLVQLHSFQPNASFLNVVRSAYSTFRSPFLTPYFWYILLTASRLFFFEVNCRLVVILEEYIKNKERNGELPGDEVEFLFMPVRIT